ncbi:MAG: type III secretion system export apparatus subunit SctV [Chloracidobacterium sp.]|nr:type III secretion system export apparatus subunit SctV [Chloracidobacterium sp.]MDW8218294.1 type III secretion system export apparatus subunit SctV [Acidobacteriota bacterium]
MASLTESVKNLSGIDFAAALSKNSDLLIAAGMLVLIGTIIVPVPTFIISVLIVVNITISLAVMMVSLYISSPLQLSTYPTILLLTTLFRLALSISCTRSILTKGDAGDVIKALGEITAQGNLVVGFVMFIILLVVQFLVVAKGAERVAEVAARFTLDALPGKQMAIDADMRSGLITMDVAKKLRSDLAKESRLYGAMDGAMKFVKGDSIATIIIAVVNIVAGIAVGVLYKGLSPAAAAKKYLILTIGDGLGAIFASIFIAISAGLVVTRVAGDDADASSNVGSDMSAQMLANPKPLLVVSGLLGSLAVLAVLAGSSVAVPVLIVAAVAAPVALSLRKRQQMLAAKAADGTATASPAAAESDEVQPSYTVPMALVASADLAPYIDPQFPAGAKFREGLTALRNSMYYDTGVLMPQIYVTGNAPLEPFHYIFAVKEIPVAQGVIKPFHFYVNDSVENIKVFGIEGEEVRNPADLRPGAWVPEDYRMLAMAAGLKIWEPSDFLLLHVSHILRRHAHEYIGIQEAQALLDFVGRGAPKLVEEVVPKIVSLHLFTDVLQRLVQEGVSIRDVKSILDALAEWGRIEKDPAQLTEYVRASLKRVISFRASGGKGTLFVYLLDPEIEDIIRGSIRRTSTAAFLALDPTISNDILAALREEVGALPPTAQKPVIVTDMDIRRFVRKLVEVEFPNVSVLSYQELSPDLTIQPIGRIALPQGGSRLAA